LLASRSSCHAEQETPPSKLKGTVGVKTTRLVGTLAAFGLSGLLCFGSALAQEESATAEDGAPASEAPAETTTAPNVPLGANLTPPVGLLPPGPALISAPGSGQPGSSSVSMAPGTQTTGVANPGPNAVVAPEAEPAPEPAPAPEASAETAPVEAAPVDAAPVETAPADAAPTEAAVATAEDLDADNYPDAAEWELGLDGNNPDTDADGVADGDEITIYGTDPLVADTDGDGVFDGEELFGIFTDPLVWDDFSTQSGEAVMQEAVENVEPVG
jgi:hypothetical protein